MCHFLHRHKTMIFLTAILFTIMTVSYAMASETGILNAKVILRKAASKTSKALQTVPTGEEVAVLGTSDDWYRVRYGNITGYMMKKYIDLPDNSVEKNQENINDLGDPPGPLYIGDEGADVKTLQSALKILGYYDMRTDGIYGNGTTTSVALYQQDAKLEPDGIAGKLTIRSIFGSCASKADISVSGREAQESSNSKTTSSASSKSQKNVVTSFSEIGSIPAASKEGDTGSKVIKLQQALYLLGYFNGEIDGSYGEITKDAVTRFQKNRKMNADGIAGAATIRVLFSGTGISSSSSTKSSSSEKEYKTLTLDWFDDKVSSLIPRNAKFTIKDVRTGKTFTAVRWSGINHLDAEPAATKDTAIMKSIYRGTWSWARRPILILYKDRVYAASMNGMPHGTTTKNNDFDGHFCIHFLNSKTHETDTVDNDHQYCVSVASKAKW